MDLYEIVTEIKDKDDFIQFVNELALDLRDRPETWENTNLASYLEALQAWVEDMDGWEKNLHIDINKMNVWQLMANILYASKMYE